MATIKNTVSYGTAQSGSRMSARSHAIHIDGIQELRHMTGTISPRVSLQLARSTVHGIAGQIRNAIRKRAPQATNTLRKAIHTKRRRGNPGEVISDVRVAHGAGVQHDAWYWHFLEFGTINQPAQPFVKPTVREYENRIPEIYRAEFGKKLEQRLAREARKQGRR